MPKGNALGNGISVLSSTTGELNMTIFGFDASLFIATCAFATLAVAIVVVPFVLMKTKRDAKFFG